jgi:hypothetical protein
LSARASVATIEVKKIDKAKREAKRHRKDIGTDWFILAMLQASIRSRT